MAPIEGVNFFKDDVSNIDNIKEISCLKSQFDLVISDLAPNLTGISTIDEENIFELNILTLITARKYLKPDSGHFIIKTFQTNFFGITNVFVCNNIYTVI